MKMEPVEVPLHVRVNVTYDRAFTVLFWAAMTGIGAIVGAVLSVIL